MGSSDTPGVVGSVDVVGEGGVDDPGAGVLVSATSIVMVSWRTLLSAVMTSTTAS
ncbi:hypothetical protein HMA55_08195 [Corynebacterium sp. zg-913]|uniref:Uncharacterized protein n=1 Tax=Corynebacterium wankanglinii TaxID=2735136 RepID=A0A7V8UV23_9CORY|nr:MULTISPECIES: hypothetical protein [Corynebacterium]MBA1837872.1 hypothetical protein [Corynebacterium wankanglinii]